MKVYIAAPYAARDQARTFAVELETAGHEVTATWLMESHEISSTTVGAATGLPDDQVAVHAYKDFADIEVSDALVLLTESVVELAGHPGGTGGRHVETGIAMAMRKVVIVVGEPENVFHRAPMLATTVVPALVDVVPALAQIPCCRECGCTEQRACSTFLETCSWTEDKTLCTFCVPQAAVPAEVPC